MSALKRKAFVNAYLGEAQGNATKAAVLAGYSDKTATQQGSRLLTKADVQSAVKRHAAKLDTSTDTALQNVARIANATPSKINGNDVVKANELILKVNGALQEKDTTSRITVNIGFIHQHPANMQLVVTNGNTATDVDVMASPADVIVAPA